MHRTWLAASILLLAPAAISAPPSAPMVVKYRHLVMEAAGEHMGALSMIAKGETDRTQDMVMHAEALLGVAKITGSLFPDGSGPQAGVQTDSKAEIWSQKDKFAAAVKAFEDESVKLVDIAKKGDVAALKAQLGAVGGTCGDCHDAFRVDDDH